MSRPLGNTKFHSLMTPSLLFRRRSLLLTLLGVPMLLLPATFADIVRAQSNPSPAAGTKSAAAVATAARSPLMLGQLAAPPAIDGSLDADEWEGAARVTLDLQIEPGENLAASEKTEVFLAADRATLFVAFRAFDSDPAGIRARVSKRDDVKDDDQVMLFLDTFDDRQRAYRFTFNPLGIQQDGIYSEPTVDESWDAQYESKGRLTPDGYTVEAAIPFKSFRFRAGKGVKWGLHLQRLIARKAERASWQPISRDVSSLLVQMGALTGLDDVFTGRTLDIIPTLVGSVNSERERIPSPPAGPDAFGYNAVNKLDPGLTAIYSVTPNLTLAATVNPDFSQVEADVPQINTNQRFAIFYPERRPFFLEGIEVFEPLVNRNFRLLNTRTIIDPDWGVKLTGKLGRNTVGLLVASDRAPGLQLAPRDPNFGKNALFTVARWQRSFRQDSAVGAFYTDRRFGRESNTALSGETRLRLSRSATFGFQLIHTRTTDAQGKTVSDWATNARLTNFGRHWRIFLNDEYVGANYSAEAGFIQRRGYHQQFADVGRVFWTKEGTKLNKWLVNVWPYFVAQRSKQPDGSPEVEYIDVAAEFSFRRNTRVNAFRTRSREGFANRELSYGFNQIEFASSALKAISFEGEFIFGEGIFYDPANPRVGRKNDVELDVSFRPSNKLNASLLYLKSGLRDRQSGERFFNQEIFRQRVIYQFTPDHSFRGLFDYDTSLRQFGSSLLYAWVPRPNTAAYLGWNDLLYNGYDPLDGQRRRGAGLVRQRRTLFFKLSYNWRR